MVDTASVIINSVGVFISLFSIFVTLNIYGKYRLQRSIFFIITAIAVFVWNLLHLFFNFVEQDTLEFGTVRILWLTLVFSGIVFVYGLIFGYSVIRFEHINYRLIIYAIMGTITMMVFIFKDDWVDVSYTTTDGWVTDVKYDLFWSAFSLSILIVDMVEIVIPLVNTYVRVNVNKRPLLVMLVGIMLAIFSNSLEPVLSATNVPQALRFLIADIGFFLFFWVLLRYPFTGMYDNTRITQVIVANANGIPYLSLSPDHGKSVLASGAIIGINSILEEITAQELPETSDSQVTRKIELGIDQFYIIIRGEYIIIYQFREPAGVCYSKFQSLSKTFGFEKVDESILNQQLEEFQQKIFLYFENTDLELETTNPV